jgi:hypothetical protein
MNQRVPWRTVLRDLRLQIENNCAENAIRSIALRRKSWLVLRSLRCGEVACRLYSLVFCCRAIGLNSERYLEALLGAASTTP